MPKLIRITNIIKILVSDDFTAEEEVKPIIFLYHG